MSASTVRARVGALLGAALLLTLTAVAGGFLLTTADDTSTTGPPTTRQPCASPTGADRETAEQYADCRASEATALSTPTASPTRNPSETPVVFGASDGEWPVNGVRRLPGIRLYLGKGDLNGSTSWTSTAELANGLARVADNGVVWLSIKDNRPADLDRVLEQFRSVTSGRKLRMIVTYRHEPENDVTTALGTAEKSADIESYQAGWASLLPVIRANGYRAATCLLGDRVSPDRPDNPESVAYHVEGVDIIGFDRYNPGLGRATSYVAPATVLEAVVQYVLNRSAEDGRRYDLGIGEWGTIAIGSDTNGRGGDQAGRRAWAQGYVEELRRISARPDIDVAFASWWNQSRMELDDDSTGQLGPVVIGSR